MSRSFISSLSIVATSLSLGLIVLTSAASADIGWIIQPQSVLGASATIHLPAYDINNPENPDPNSDGYVPPIEITSIPQTDPGTSGDPALGKAAVNSLMGTGTGYFTTLGNTPTTSIDFGPKTKPHASGDLTIKAVPIGNFYPNIAGEAQVPTFDANNQPVYDFGSPSSVINAATLWTQTPLSGYNALTGNDFSQASRDNGRIAGFGLASVPYSDVGALPVTAGQFDASKLNFWGTVGISLSIAVAADPDALEGVSAASLVLDPGTVGINDVENTLTGAIGTITRSGPDYILTAPFNYNFVITENPDGSAQLTVPLTINLVAKANIVAGDVNFDGIVDIQDITLMANKWLSVDANNLGQGDANGDGIVDIQDITLAANKWLQTPPPLGGGGSINSVPEPSSLLLIGFGAVSMLFVARRRARR